MSEPKPCLVCEKELAHPTLQMHLECHEKAFLALLSRKYIPMWSLRSYIPREEKSND